MLKISVLLLLLTSDSISAAQTYSPKMVGNQWTFRMGDGSFNDEILEGTFSYKGKDYLKVQRTYSWGNADLSYFRVDEAGTTFYLDPKSKLESIELPAEPNVGDTWTSADGAWKYTVTDLNAAFETNKKTFADCLVVEARQLTGRDKEKLLTYHNFYGKGIGYIGSRSDGYTIAYIEKWNVK